MVFPRFFAIFPRFFAIFERANAQRRPAKKQTDIEPKKENKLKKNLKFFSPNHHGHIVLAYDLFKKNKIFGVGPKGFRHYCRSVNYNSKIGLCSTHPHNFLIQFLSELGLLGMLFYLITFYFLISKTIKCTRSKISLRLKNSFYVISIGLIINFFPFLPSGNFFNNWNSFSYFYLIGIYLYTYRKCLNRL